LALKVNVLDFQYELVLTNRGRIRKAHPNVNSFYKRMMVRSLAADPIQLRDGWLHLAKLCQDQHVEAGRAILTKLEDGDRTVRKNADKIW
jgi:hypothetical protein